MMWKEYSFSKQINYYLKENKTLSETVNRAVQNANNGSNSVSVLYYQEYLALHDIERGYNTT